MPVELSHEEMVEVIRKHKGDGTIAGLARERNLNPQHISNILCGREDISAKVAAAFGFRRLMKFRKAPVAQLHRATHS